LEQSAKLGSRLAQDLAASTRVLTVGNRPIVAEARWTLANWIERFTKHLLFANKSSKMGTKAMNTGRGVLDKFQIRIHRKQSTPPQSVV